MPGNLNKFFNFLTKYVNEVNLKMPYLKNYLESVDIKNSNKLVFLKDYFSSMFDNTKWFFGVEPNVQKTLSSRLELPKFVEGLQKNVSAKKERIIPKWKTRRPTVTLEGINMRTSLLLSSIASAGLLSSRLKRLEELFDHLMQHPEAKIFALKSGAIRSLLFCRSQTGDEASLDMITTILAALGYADPPKSSGIRILSIDGGGMRGLAVLHILQKIEEISGRRTYELFDFICGVSTGAIITCGLVPPNKMPIHRIQELYLELSQKVFNQSAFWGASKLVWSHAYYDTELWEKFLVDHVGKLDLLETNKLKSCPKIAVVSAIVNDSKVAPFIFRNYGNPCYKPSDYRGSYKHTMFEAVRASAAAPTIFEEFKTGNILHQDGGIVVNNPAAIALHEALCLWPDEDINCIVSIGTGRYNPLHKEDQPESSVLSSSWKQKFDRILESATDTEGVHRVLNDLLPDGAYFRLNPHLSRSVTMDETSVEKLNSLQDDTQMYCRRNEEKFFELVEKVTEPRSVVKRIKDSVILQLRLSGWML